MMMRVKLVIISTIDGRMVSRPMTTRICRLSVSGLPLPATSSSAWDSASDAPGVPVAEPVAGVAAGAGLGVGGAGAAVVAGAAWPVTAAAGVAGAWACLAMAGVEIRIAKLARMTAS